MQSIRLIAAILAVASLVACAAVPVQPAASTAQPDAPTSMDVQSVTIDTARVRAAAREFGARPAFGSCIDAAAGGAAATQACIDDEVRFHQSRIDTALATRRGALGSNGDPDAVQAQWRAERDRICGPDGAVVAPQRRIDAGLCRLEATAARASVLSR